MCTRIRVRTHSGTRSAAVMGLLRIDDAELGVGVRVAAPVARAPGSPLRGDNEPSKE